MDGSTYALIAPVLFLFLGVTLALLARYAGGAVITGAIAYLILRAILPVRSSKLLALRGLRDVARELWANSVVFAELFAKDLRPVFTVALVTGAILGIIFIVWRARWS